MKLISRVRKEILLAEEMWDGFAIVVQMVQVCFLFLKIVFLIIVKKENKKVFFFNFGEKNLLVSTKSCGNKFCGIRTSYFSATDFFYPS